MEMNSCLEYIESVLTDPDKAMPWDAWWQQQHEDAKASFTHREYLELKFKKAEAASRIFTKHTGFYIVLKLGRFTAELDDIGNAISYSRPETFCGQSVEFGGLCEQSMVIAEHWIRFWQKSN